MSDEKRRSSSGQIGTLGGCLIEGDSEQKARERKVKRRALTISVGLQSAVIVALVLVPLLGRTEKVPFTWYTPVPQYYHSASQRTEVARPAGPIQRRECVVCFNRNLAPHAPTQSSARPTEGPIGEVNLGPGGDSTNRPDGLNIFDSRNQPPPPEDPNRNQPKRLRVGHIEPAMILRRVEPVYPPVARQLRHAGAVHMRAVISTTGSIESLEVLDGDPLLIQSAKEAVLQWQYRPTYLNGRAVEVETIITVIYTLNQ